MKPNLLFCICLILSAFSLQAQPFSEGGKTRHRFAQMHLGMQSSYYFAPKESPSIGSHFQQSLAIGALHFWGHADFLVRFPVQQTGNKSFKTGISTEAKCYPFKLKNNAIRPFGGCAWQMSTLSIENGTLQSRYRLPLFAGFSGMYKHLMADFIFGMYNNTNEWYYTSRHEQQLFATPKWMLALQIKYWFDTTLSAEKDWQSGKTKILTDTLSKLKKLSGLTLAVGVSTATFLKNNVYNEQELPFLGQHRTANVFPEFGIGYFLQTTDLQFSAIFRSITSELRGHGFEQQFRRKTFTFEAYKFFADYHGFVPFVGPAISWETLSAEEQNLGISTWQSRESKPALGLTFGWDIRPNELQLWYLRTHLRWFPSLLLIRTTNQNFDLSQLEVNFISLVVFPSRL